MQPIIFDLPHQPILNRYLNIKDTMEWSNTPHSQRWIKHSDPVIENFARAVVHPIASQHLGYAVKPTYSFLSRYIKGSWLKRHVDRPMCVWTVTQTIAVDPPHRAKDWPLFINDQPICLDVGQAAIFCGVAYPHWRLPMPDEMADFVNCYFHFVPLDYDGPIR